MSVGGLLLDRRWQRAASRSRARLYVPSGALAGLDAVKAMAVGRIRRMQLTTRKPPRALADAPYVHRTRLRLDRLRRPRRIFEGSARAAIRAFPQNTNIASTLTLAGGRQARVRVVADPTIRRNVHELKVEGDCGRITCAIESRPSANPKTSELAVRSAIATLGRIFDPVVIGT
jgi:aspartate dehydrogenase